MTNRAITIADIDAAIAAENQRHETKLAELQTTRRVLANFLEGSDRASVSIETRQIVYDAAEYGGKKKLLLRLIMAEKDGLSSWGVVAAAQKAGLPDAKPENIVPQLSYFKSSGLLTQPTDNWIITSAGREYLADHKN